MHIFVQNVPKTTLVCMSPHITAHLPITTYHYTHLAITAYHQTHLLITTHYHTDLLVAGEVVGKEVVAPARRLAIDQREVVREACVWAAVLPPARRVQVARH